MASIELQVKVSWWLKAYLYALVFLCELTDSEPDLEKVGRVVLHGVRLVEKAP